MQKLVFVVVLGVLGAARSTASVVAQNPPPTTDNPPATAAIVGIVTDDATGKPVTGALVSISPASGTPPLTRRDDLQVLTGADGRFLFAQLAQGLYSLNGQKAGYLPGSAGSSTGAMPMLVDVAAAQIRADVVIRLRRPGVITGTIVDEAGDPVIGAQVQVARRARNRGRLMFQVIGGSTGTDDRGIYRVGSLTPGDYIVMIDQAITNLPTAMIDAYQKSLETRRPGEASPLSDELIAAGGMGATPGTASGRLINSQVQALPRESALVPSGAGGPAFVYPSIYYPAALTASKATIVTVRSGEERGGIDMVMRPVRSISISGTVNGPDGPARLTAVSLTLTDGLETPFGGGKVGTSTDASGRFTFLGVPTGDYVLRVTKIPSLPLSNMVTNSITLADGTTSFMASSSGPIRTPPLPPDPTLWAEVPVAAGARDITDLSVDLQPGARITGRVVFEGALARPTPQQMSGMSISLQPVSGARALRNPRTRIDEQGQVTSQGFPSGEYAVSVFGAPTGWSLLSVTARGVDVSERPFEIGASDISDLVITLTDQAAELTGTVSARDGSVPKAAGVILFPADEPLAHDYGLNPRRVLATRCSANGRYAFKGFPPGDYRVIAIEDVSALADLSAEFVQPLAQRAVAVRVSKGEKRQQNLTAVAK